MLRQQSIFSSRRVLGNGHRTWNEPNIGVLRLKHNIFLSLSCTTGRKYGSQMSVRMLLKKLLPSNSLLRLPVRRPFQQLFGSFDFHCSRLPFDVRQTTDVLCVSQNNYRMCLKPDGRNLKRVGRHQSKCSALNMYFSKWDFQPVGHTAGRNDPECYWEIVEHLFHLAYG